MTRKPEDKAMVEKPEEKALREELGWRFTCRRKELGLRQGVVAARSELSQSLYCMMEGGKRSPTVVALLKIARALELPAGEFLEGME